MSFLHPHCGGRHETVAEARICQGIQTATETAQLSTRIDLAAHARSLRTVVAQAAATVATLPKPIAAGPVTEDGMYRMPDGTIYKVQYAVHGSGQLYAKRMVKLDEPYTKRSGRREVEVQYEFEYERGAIHNLTSAMKLSIEDAVEFGRLYGACMRCGATLTAEESIKRGMGPYCAGKF